MSVSPYPATTSPASPVRVAFAPSGGSRARRRLRALLEAFPDRVEVLSRRGSVEPDVVLLDPCVGGRDLDLATLGDQAGIDGPMVVYTSEPVVDPLAFAMAGSVMDGRLRGWLSTDLTPEALLDAIERIHGGEIVLEPPAA